MGDAELARALVRAEDRLRAHGLTGAQAFDVLLPALEERLGLIPRIPAPDVARDIAADVPLAEGTDLLGLTYERFFADLFKGLRGQFFTPASVGRLLVSRLALTPSDVVLDPTCGSGGLLVVAAGSGARLRGIELDPRLARLAGLNLRLGGSEAAVRCADFFAAEPEPVDVIVANPPFSVDITDPAVLARYETGRGRTRVSSDRLFVEAIERWVRPGGRAGFVVPFSVLTNPSWADVRERIDRAWHRTAICTLPEGVFRPFGGAAGRAVLLWLERRPSTSATCVFAELVDPGYDVRNKRVRRTRDAEIDARCEGQGFVPIPDDRWTPTPTRSGLGLGTLVKLRTERIFPARAGGPIASADLADADRTTGEIHPRTLDAGDLKGPRARIVAGDLLVAQLRPNLGNVGVAPGAMVGSPEWIVLEPVRCGHYVLHALRTPTWRAALPIASGQTRPRTSGEQVVGTAVPWPGDALALRIDALSSGLFAERARLRARIVAVQDAVDRFAAGDLTPEGLGEAIDGIERASVDGNG